MQPVSWNNGYDGASIAGNLTLPIPPSGGGGAGVYDYYIRDYQENVRMILTEETHYSLGKCTMENDRAGNEEPVFGQTGAGNEVSSTRFTKPAGWTSNTTNNVSKLSKATGKPVGPNSLLKIMAGDEINASTQYYYEGTPSNNTNSFTTDILTSLASAISGSNVANSLTKSQVTTITSSLNSTPGFNSLVNPHQSSTDNLPKAYLTILYFDERFNYVGQGSTFERTTQSGDYAQPLVIASKAPKNGYAYIYVSNETDLPVYFDNLTVAHTRGRIIEEDHYYAFGLKIAGISSVKLSDPNEGNINNKNLYNDKELIDEADLNWYDYGFRSYDPQIGRFPQLDPLTDDYPHYTPYQYAGNEPIANVDVDGLEPLGVTSKIVDLGGGVWNTIITPAAKVAQGASAASKVASIASMTVNAAKVLTTLDGQKSLSSDVEKRLHVGLVKEVNKAWKHVVANKYENSITGQTWYKPTAVEAVYPEVILIPLPKFGWALKLLGRGGEAALEGGIMSLAETAQGIIMPGGKIIGAAGSKAAIREIPGGMQAAQSYWSRLVATGAKPVIGSRYKGILMKLPNGGTVGFRTLMTKSPGTAATIDVNIPGLFQGKLKFNP